MVQQFFQQLLYLIILQFTHTQAICNIELSSDRDIYEVGQTMSVTCTISGDCDVAQVQAHVNGQMIPIDSTRSGMNTATFMLRNLLKEHNNAEIQCSEHSGSHSSTKTIKVGVPPEKPYDIQCVDYNLKSLTCTWQPKTQDTGLLTSQTLTYSKHSLNYPPPTSHMYPCPEQHENTCVWEGSSYNRNNYWRVRVVASNSLGTEATELSFRADSRVKLDPVKSLTLVAASDSLQVTWSRPIQSHIIHDIMYEITVVSQWQTTPVVKMNMTADGEALELDHTVRQLIPHTQYTVSVRCVTVETRDNKVDGHLFWSDAASQTSTTLPDVPKSAPDVTPGGYSSWGEETQVVWQPVPPAEVQGELQDTRVRAHPRSNQPGPPSCTDSKETLTKNVGRGYTSNLALEVNRTYDICVDIRNNVGYNDSLQIWAIRRPAVELSSPEFYVTSDGEQVTVHILDWSLSLNYTIFWCEGFLSRKLCDNQPFQWITIDNKVSTLSSIPAINPVIAMATNHITNSTVLTSGMHFAPHIFQAGLGIRKPTEVQVTPTSIQGTLHVQWRKPKYSDTAYIDHFRVLYCPENLCDGSNDTIERVSVGGRLDGKFQTYELQGLTPGRTYYIRVQSVGDNTTSNYTDPIHVTLPETGLEKKYIIAISVSAAIALVLVGAGIYTITKYCKDKCKKFMAPIEIIEIPDDFADKYRKQQNGEATGSVADPYAEIDDGRGCATYWPGREQPEDESHADTETFPSATGSAYPATGHALSDQPAPETEKLMQDQRLDSNGLFNHSGQPLLHS